MRKIPTLFERKFEKHKVVGISDKLTDPEFARVLDGECRATLKVDGSCCAILGHYLYKRFDAKPGRKSPENSIPCCDPDPITGHWPHWAPVLSTNPGDKWFIEALIVSNGRLEATSTCRVRAGSIYTGSVFVNGTYEAIGKHFNGNPYKLDTDILVKHGAITIHEDLSSFDTVKCYLRDTPIEGIVFWDDGSKADGIPKPICKIKRSDFGFKWPVDGAKYIL